MLGCFLSFPGQWLFDVTDGTANVILSKTCVSSHVGICPHLWLLWHLKQCDILPSSSCPCSTFEHYQEDYVISHMQLSVVLLLSSPLLRIVWYLCWRSVQCLHTIIITRNSMQLKYYWVHTKVSDIRKTRYRERWLLSSGGLSWRRTDACHVNWGGDTVVIAISQGMDRRSSPSAGGRIFNEKTAAAHKHPL